MNSCQRNRIFFHAKKIGLNGLLFTPKVPTKSWIQYQQPFPKNLRRIFVATLSCSRYFYLNQADWNYRVSVYHVIQFGFPFCQKIPD